MSFSTEPKASPVVSQPPGASARDRAIAIVSGSRQAEQPVPNATQVQPEEMSAITSQAAQGEGQNDTSVAPSEPPQEATRAKEEPLSSQYALLARKEKALRAKVQQQEQAFKAREDALKAREAELSGKSQEYSPDKYIAKDRLQQDTLTTLLEAGLTYDQITQAALSQQQQDPATKYAMDQLRAEIKALKDAQERSAKTYEEGQQNSYKQALNQIKVEAQQLVKGNPEFETIRATNSVSDVVELIERTYNEDGRLLSVEEAATEIENYLVEEALKLSRLSKVRQKLQPTQAPASKQVTQAPDNKQPQLRTLTNAVGTARKLSAKERAILAFRGELK